MLDFEVLIEMKFSFRAFILAVICAKNVYSCDLSAQTDRGIQRAINLGKIERLYLGSSMFRKGINIYEMEKKSSPSFLIWYGGLDPVYESMMLEYIITCGVAIKNLYIDMYAYSISSPSWPSGAQTFFEAPLDLKIKIWRLIMNNKRTNLIPAAWDMFVYSGNDMFILWPLFREILNRMYYRGGYPNPIRNYQPSVKLEYYPLAMRTQR